MAESITENPRLFRQYRRRTHSQKLATLKLGVRRSAAGFPLGRGLRPSNASSARPTFSARRPPCAVAARLLEPSQADVIEKILRHCGLWCPSSPRAPPTEDGWVHDPDGDADSHWASAEPRELTFVDEGTFWATF